jgi:hypothetical protein
MKKILLKKQNNNNQRSTSASNLFESKKQIQNNVKTIMSKIFNESERKALSTLFNTEKEFEYFNQKINILYNHNSMVERKLLMKIKMLMDDNKDKTELVHYLQGKLKECETKVRILDHKLNCEKFLLRQTKKASNKNQNSLPDLPNKITFNSLNKDNKNGSPTINQSADN